MERILATDRQSVLVRSARFCADAEPRRTARIPGLVPKQNMFTQPSRPVACSLDSRDLRARIAWFAELDAQQLLRRERHGAVLKLTYRAAAGPRVRELVAKEEACCPFLDFAVAETGESVVLTITVPAEHAASADSLLHPFTGHAAAPPPNSPLKSPLKSESIPT